MERKELKDKAPDLVVSEQIIADDVTVKDLDASQPLPASSGTERDSLVGKTIGGHYEVVAKIGEGGMSTVYKARHILLDKLVAIKFILPRLIDDAQTIRRFQQEAKAATQLNHENICPVKEFEIFDENRAFLVMEYVEGKSLKELIAEEGKLNTERALLIASQICAGLAHAHSKGVIHRDIKPANIVLVKDAHGKESVRIVDFGIAKILREDSEGPNLTQTGDVFGTPNYMSPEQCLGKKVDGRSDIYSVGCVMHEMLFGKPPFSGDSIIETVMKHVNELPDLQSSNAMHAVLLKCLEKSAESRYSNANELLDDIQSRRSNTALVHAKVASSRSRNLVGVAIILTCLTVAGIFFNMAIQAGDRQRTVEKQWIAENQIANNFIQEKKWDDAEKSLERSIEIAKRSNSREHMTLSLNSLANVENNLGKTQEAQAHLSEAMARPSTSRLQHMFTITAFALMALGAGIFVIFMLLFGPSRRDKNFWNRSLKDVLAAKRNSGNGL